MGTYHKDIGFPKCIKMPYGESIFYASRHSRKQAISKNFSIPSKIMITGQNIIEIHTNNQVVEKCLIRYPYTNQIDLCLVINPILKIIITAWLNKRNDTHKSLNKTKYSQKDK
jgi:hypothetical protein